jgi:hypothetical protein
MPIKSSLGALRQELPNIGKLSPIYWIDLTVGNAISASSFDSLGHLHFISASNRIVSLTDRNITLSTDLYTGTFQTSVASSMATNGNNHTVAIGFSKTTAPPAFGFIRLTSGNVANSGFAFSSAGPIGNVTIDNLGNFILSGQGATSNTSGRYGLVSKIDSNLTLQYATDIRLPVRTAPLPSFDWIINANDAISDGSNVYVTGEYENTLGSLRDGFILKLNSAGSLVWARTMGFDGKRISFINGTANLVVIGNSSTGNTVGSAVKWSNAGVALAAAQFNNNIYANTNTNAVSLNVDDGGNVVIGGQYLKLAGSPNKLNGYVIGLDSNLSVRFTKEISSTMVGTTLATVLSLSQQLADNSLYITVQNTNLGTFNGLLLKVPYNGTSPGTGNYTVGTSTVLYTNTSDVSVLTYSPSSGNSNIFVQTTSTSTTGVTVTIAPSVLPITKQIISA